MSTVTAQACSEMRVNHDVAVDCLELRIRKMGPSIRRIRNAGIKAPALSTFAGQVDPSLVLGHRSRVGCGCGLPRIAHSQN